MNDDEKFAFGRMINLTLKAERWCRENTLPINPFNIICALHGFDVLKLSTDGDQIESIKRLVCREHRITMTEMKSKKRTAAIVKARQTAMAECRLRTDATLSEIGKHFNRTHSTVLYAVTKELFD